MNNQKLMKKIFSLARYDFNNNLSKWLTISCLQAVIMTIIFCGLCYITSDFDVVSWKWAPNVLFDSSNKLYNLMSGELPVWMLGITLLVIAICGVLLPLVTLQNSLDLAFDSSMSGFSINSYYSLYNYLAAMLIFNGLFLALVQLVSGFCIIMLFYVMQGHYQIHLASLNCCMFIISCLFLYGMQMNYLLSMHILEYKKNLWESCKEFYAMIQGKLFFLSKILVWQLCGVIIAITALYLFFGIAITFITIPLITWMINVLQLAIEPVFITMLHNFFYLWAYALFYAWICLVIAHVYRQLICPPLDTIACPSCTSCEK